MMHMDSVLFVSSYDAQIVHLGQINIKNKQ